MASNNHHQIGIDANGLKMDKVVFKFDNYEKKVFDLQIKGSFAPGVSNGVIKLFGSDDGVAQSFIANNNNNNNNSNHEVDLEKLDFNAIVRLDRLTNEQLRSAYIGIPYLPKIPKKKNYI
ncbi:unnamed protein product [Adineta ricciae]|uniref:Uncharacterized protein n=1 Tax=Adineta ricciae TaxID=249248 RepID=A0A815S6N8_ADIRI|nr:unnamed protein product [Adineta ricciae]